MPQFGLLLPLAAAVIAAPQAPSSVPVSGENGEMGGVFGMGLGSGKMGGLPMGGKGKSGGGLEALAGLFNPKNGGKGTNALSGILGQLGSLVGMAGKGGAGKGGLGSLMGSFDITKMIPTGPEYPTGKTTLADYYDGGSGAYPARLLTEPTLPKHTIYAPKTPPPKNVKMPVLIWGNGGCTSSGTPYGLFLTNIASHGYLAIANGPPGGAPPSLDTKDSNGLLPGPKGESIYNASSAMAGGMSKVQDMLDAIDWVVKGNADKYGNIDKDTFITAGSSCGGLEAYSAAYHNDRVKLIGVYNSGVIYPRKKPLLQELKASVLIMNGGPKDVGYANGETDFQQLTKVPVYYANLDTGHLGTFFAKGGGKYATASIALFDWLFRGDAKGKAMWTDPASPNSLKSQHWNITIKAPKA